MKIMSNPFWTGCLLHVCPCEAFQAICQYHQEPFNPDNIPLPVSLLAAGFFSKGHLDARA